MSFFSAIWPLNQPGRYIHWHFISLSVGNLIVVLLMVLTFVGALVAPFPGRERRGGKR